jgi:hypothetical protein
MNQQLDRLLADLGEAPPDGRLAQVEDRVWRRIAGRREARALAPVRAAMVGAALAAGLAAGGVSAAAAGGSTPAEMAALSKDFAYAPSNLLDQDL